MSLVGREPVHVYLGLTEGGILVKSQPVEWVPYDDVQSGLPVLFAKVGAAPRRFWQRRTPVRVWLSGALARPFLFGPVSGVQTWDEVIAVAEAAAPEAAGVDGPCSVQVETWPDTQPTVATAVEKALLDAIELAASEHRLNIRSMRPWWAAALNHIVAKDALPRLACINDRDSMILFGGTQGHFDTINPYVPRMSSEQTEKLLSRLALVAGTPIGEVPRVSLTGLSESLSNDVPFGSVGVSL